MTTSAGGGGFWDFLGNVSQPFVNMFTGQGGMGGGSFLPAMASAGMLWNDADKYATRGKQNRQDIMDWIAQSQGQFNQYGQQAQDAYGRAGQGARDDYMALAREAANRADPFQQAARRPFQDRLNQYYADPMKYLEMNPEFMASKRLGEGALARQNAARGVLEGNAGKATSDQEKFLSDLSARYVNQDLERLYKLGGFQFDPASQAQILAQTGGRGIDMQGQLAAQGAGANLNAQMAGLNYGKEGFFKGMDLENQGYDREMQAKMAAAAAAAYPFGAGGRNGAGPGGGGGGGGWNVMDLISQFNKAGGNAGGFSLLDALIKGGGSAGNAASNFWNAIGGNGYEGAGGGGDVAPWDNYWGGAQGGWDDAALDGQGGWTDSADWGGDWQFEPGWDLGGFWD